MRKSLVFIVALLKLLSFSSSFVHVLPPSTASVTCGVASTRASEAGRAATSLLMRSTPLPPHAVTISYCPGCCWLHRSQWYVTELMLTFNERAASKGETSLLKSASVVASDVSGTFVVEVDGEVVWDRATDGGFPEIRELKRRVRDAIGGGGLGHSELNPDDRRASTSTKGDGKDVGNSDSKYTRIIDDRKADEEEVGDDDDDDDDDGEEEEEEEEEEFRRQRRMWGVD